MLASRFWLGIVGICFLVQFLFVLLLFASPALGQSAPVSLISRGMHPMSGKSKQMREIFVIPGFNVDPGQDLFVG